MRYLEVKNRVYMVVQLTEAKRYDIAWLKQKDL